MKFLKFICVAILIGLLFGCVGIPVNSTTPVPTNYNVELENHVELFLMEQFFSRDYQ